MDSQVLERRNNLLDPMRVPHLTAREREEVTRLLARLEAECPEDVHRVILYGSKARGTADGESDVDLLIAANNGAECIERVVKDLKKNIDFLLIPLILSSGDYEYHKHLLPPLYVNIRREGVELWDEQAAEMEAREVPLDFWEGEFRAMNESTLELIRKCWENSRYFWEQAMYLKNGGFL